LIEKVGEKKKKRGASPSLSIPTVKDGELPVRSKRREKTSSSPRQKGERGVMLSKRKESLFREGEEKYSSTKLIHS